LTPAAKNAALDALSVATVGIVFLGRGTKFDEREWWLGPLVIMSIGWSLWRRKSFLGPWLIAFGAFLFYRNYRKWRVQQEVVKSFALL
jgi:hypothetical protein